MGIEKGVANLERNHNAFLLWQSNILSGHLLFKPAKELFKLFIVILNRFDGADVVPPEGVHVTEQSREDLPLKVGEPILLSDVCHVLQKRTNSQIVKGFIIEV